MTGEEETFCQRVIEAASARPGKVALVLITPNGAETVTFGEMLTQIRSLAYRLEQEGIAFGDRVAILGENHPNWVIAYLGTIYRGAVVVPFDPATTIGMLAEFLNDSETKLAFVSPAAREKFRAASERAGRAIPMVSLRPDEKQNVLAHFEDWAQTIVPTELNSRRPPARAEDIAVLMYTSGTTGTPKTVPLTHGNLYAESDKLRDAMRVTDREVILSLLPLFHSYPQSVNLWLATIIGARVIYLTELTSVEIERGLKESHATALVGVPRLWYLFHKKIFDAVRARSASVRILFRALLALNGALRDTVGINLGRIFFRRVHQSFGGRLRLTVSGGASFDQEVARDFHRLGFTIIQGYGLTETSGAATVTRFEDNKIGSVGTPLSGVEVKIDRADREGVGEVLIRGAVVMPGYYRNPEANREAFTHDGWFRSGDLGRFDDEGHLYIVGRKKDVIKLPSGKNVFPEDVEAHYERSHMVSEVCVLGIKDETSEFKSGEKLCAVVVPNFEYLKERKITGAQEWVRFELENLGRELPEYQRVHDFRFRAEPLPRTSTRKLRRFELQEQLQTSEQLVQRARKAADVKFTSADRELRNSPAGRALVSAIEQHAPDKLVHPQMNLEIDLGLDSLARAECIVSLEHALGIELPSEEASAALKVGELIGLANAKMRVASASPSSTTAERDDAQSAVNSSAVDFRWHEVLNNAPRDVAEVRPLLKQRRAAALFAYILLRLFHWLAHLFFHLEVKGGEVLARLKPPYLICPNHQSYIDPFLVCSAYPKGVLRNSFHMGASMYFTNFFTAQLARLLNVVPVDTDSQLMRAMRAGAEVLRAAKILNIYPEGQRSFDGALQEFKKGAAILATELNVPLVPVALDGTYRIWPRNSRRIHLAKVSISFGEPILARDLAKGVGEEEAVYERVTAELKERIQRMLDVMRAGANGSE